MTDQSMGAKPQTTLWPGIILAGISLALALRLFEHFTGLRAFEPKEFLNLPVFLTVLLCAAALLSTNPDDAKPEADSKKSRRRRRAWRLIFVISSGSLAVRAVLHWAGVIDYQETGGVALALLAFLVYPLWTMRMR